MDPSCTLGFYCRDKADFEMFCAQVDILTEKKEINQQKYNENFLSVEQNLSLGS